MLKELVRRKLKEYDVTIFQTPIFREYKGYRQVYRLTVESSNHESCLHETFRLFNVPDIIPPDFNGRFLGTGDILLIDEGLKGQHYYQLKPGGWQKINRIHLR
jgi:hypothetical protein